jgi:hypothetical protein
LFPSGREAPALIENSAFGEAISLTSSITSSTARGNGLGDRLHLLDLPTEPAEDAQALFVEVHHGLLRSPRLDATHSSESGADMACRCPPVTVYRLATGSDTARFEASPERGSAAFRRRRPTCRRVQLPSWHRQRNRYRTL